MVWGAPCTPMFIATVLHYLVLWVDLGPEGVRQHSFRLESLWLRKRESGEGEGRV